MRPDEILAESFRIIEAEVGPHPFDAVEWPVVRRMIHACGDLGLVRDVAFSAGAVAAGARALREATPVVTDVGMVAAGIHRPSLEALEIRCLMTASTTSTSSVPAAVRSIDGMGNNVSSPTWGSAGIDLLRKAGVVVADGNKAIAVAESTAGVVNMLATNKAQLGIVYATDAVAGFPLARPLPADQQPIEYVVAQARDPALDTKPFLAFLKSPQAQVTFKAAGLRPIDE